ncbi:tetratricopeptide repeat protein [Campylobacter volucris]|uniref:tetratricopeptide repeat protein n=1 Tax=Campylobacter volucris TaxID=1031542 RepID=UPI00189DD373|nr:tetratricopeptide repeat protein [Campylobacter volucris]MBF7068838.1 sel1 repeat family protein [Campylobacter volucris]
MKKILIVLTILFSNFVFSQEDLITKGFEAYSRGDYLIALKCFKKSCSLNSGDGCSNLGAMYANGFGVKKDISKALEYFGKACDLRDDLGCQNYARLKQ